jgi:hypothetical protein
VTDWPGESYDPLLMSLVKHFKFSVDEGERCYIFKLRHNRDMDCSSRGWMGKTKWKCLWTRYDGRCQAHQFVKNRNAAWFFHTQVSRVYQDRSTTQQDIQPIWQLWEALASTWASIPVKRFLHHFDFQYQEGILKMFCTCISTIWRENGSLNSRIENCLFPFLD